MAPYILDGDKVIVKKQETVENGEIAAVLINNEATLKIVKYVGDKIILIPKNDAYDPLVLSPDNQNQVLG
ncbi:LexA family protein, partial [Lactobacillus delbrueckii subsp. bulgaricus]